MGREIGWIGLGKMGQPMARNLIENGYSLTVFNRTAGKCAPLVAAGATIAADLQSLAANTDVLISMIDGDSALEHITFGPGGIFSAARAGSVYIDMSTVSPTASARVATAAAECDIAYLRAPVSGSTSLAEAGNLTIMVSGPVATYEKYQALFEVLGGKLFHVGPGEEARFIKLVVNVMAGITAAMMGEALTFGEGGGMDWAQMLEIVGASAVASPLVNYKLDQMRERDFTPAFTTVQLAKDFDLVLETARAKNIPMPITSLVRQNLSAMMSTGRGELDFFGYVELSEELAGIPAIAAAEIKAVADQSRRA